MDERSHPNDAMTEDELAGNASKQATTTTKNAFTELMSRRSPPNATTSSRTEKRTIHPPGVRDGLGVYTRSPTTFPPSVVLSHDANFVTINDLYPKASIHLLLLPRDPVRQLLHPFEALDDPAFLALVQAETAKLRRLAASELRRRFGRFSATDAARNDALTADVPTDTLPPGRDWEASIISGVHAHPSMNHLHIHVLSVDHFSDCMRHRKHYNSFKTPFLVPVEDFPLAKSDKRRHSGYMSACMSSDLVCWRCNRNFENKFAALKSHLTEEFEEWRRE